MLRRAAVSSLVVLALSAGSVLAAAKTVSIYSSYYSPSVVTLRMGGAVQWKNTTGQKHNVTPDSFFLASWFLPSTTIKPHATSATRTFPEAGTFSYHDSLHSALHGIAQVPMTADAASASVGQTVTLTLGTVPASSGGPVYHEVQARLGTGTWTTIATTSDNTASFQPNAAGTWQLHTRLHHALGGATTGWSPILTIVAN